jgi:hypothetical protein
LGTERFAALAFRLWALGALALPAVWRRFGAADLFRAADFRPFGAGLFLELFLLTPFALRAAFFAIGFSLTGRP